MKKFPNIYTDKYKHFFEHMTLSSYFLENLIIRGRIIYSGFWGFEMSETLEGRRWRGLCTYLQLLCDEKQFFDSYEMKLFLGLGSTLLRPDLGRKGYAGYLKKANTFGGLLPEWATNRVLEFVNENCWVVLHDNCIGIYQSSFSQQPVEVLEVDADFKFVRMGKEFEVKTKAGVKYFRAYNKNHAIDWEENIVDFYKNIFRSKTTTKKLVDLSKSESKLLRGSDNKFKSFSPERAGVVAGVFTYSKDYMAHLTLALLNAKKEICIASWKLSPSILLTRDDMPHIRLDQLLLMKARSGVLINIMLYQEVGIAAQGNDSASAQQYLESLHPNICCQRHGCRIVDMKQWSHHEKLVIIDRNVAYVGGIDLAYHRWDDEIHQLFDIKGTKFPGHDYSQPAKTQYVHPKKKLIIAPIVKNDTNILMGLDADLPVHQKYDFRMDTPRLPWHDLHCFVKGIVAKDVVCHFIERWNMITVKIPATIKSIVGEQDKQWRLLQPTDDSFFGICAACGKNDIEETVKMCPKCSHDLGPISPYIDNENILHIETPNSSRFTYITFNIEYYRLNFSLYTNTSPLFHYIPVVGASLRSTSSVENLSSKGTESVSGTVIFRNSGPTENINYLISRGLHPQLGDILLSIDDDAVSHLDENSINNLLANKDDRLLKKFTFRRFYTKKRIESDNSVICEQSIELEFELQISMLYHKYASRINNSCIKSNSSSCNVQVLRSVGPWSIGWKGTTKETSIYNCYLEEIKNAEHFIYIENQFFVSNLADDTAQNFIADALVKKIVERAMQNKKFHVTIILPQFPTGDYITKVSTQSIMHYQYATIRNTLKFLQMYYDDEFQKIGGEKRKENIMDYIDFFCLRRGGIIDEYFTSSQIYVHDKLMIIDDKVMIAGSANINDRSMLGTRDSEVALRIEDSNLISTTMNGEPYQASNLVHHVRVKLMGQHVGAIEPYEKYNYPNLPDLELVSELIKESNGCSITETIDGLVNEKLDSDKLQQIDSSVKYIKSDLKDFLSSYNYWRNTAIYNTLIYKVLDDKCDVYCSKSLPEFTANIQTGTRYLHENDSRLNHKKRLKGFLLLFPTRHLISSNLKSTFIPPSLVT